jgi:hypothetical protein
MKKNAPHKKSALNTISPYEINYFFLHKVLFNLGICKDRYMDQVGLYALRCRTK